MAALQLWFLFSAFLRVQSFSQMKSNILQPQRNSTDLLEMKPVKIKDVGYQDYLGGTLPKVDFTTTKFAATVQATTKLFHASVPRIATGTDGKPAFKAQPTFFAADPIQSLLHACYEADRIQGGDNKAWIYSFEVHQDIDRLVYFVRGNYQHPWDSTLTKPSFVKVETEEHQELIAHVCGNPPITGAELIKGYPEGPPAAGFMINDQKASGWRAAWDQDEVMLCDPSPSLTFKEEQQFFCPDLLKQIGAGFLVADESKRKAEILQAFQYLVLKRGGHDPPVNWESQVRVAARALGLPSGPAPQTEAIYKL